MRCLEQCVAADGHRDLAFDVTDDRVGGGRVGRDEQREDVELGPDEAGGASLEEAWLPQVQAEPLLR